MPSGDADRLQLGRGFWLGLGLLLVGSGPLLTVMLLAALGVLDDPNPNPVGFGILAAFTFWPALLMMLVSYGRAVLRRDRLRQQQR